MPDTKKYNEADYHVLDGKETVTNEILVIVRNKVDGWYPEGRIDWENVWDRVDDTELDNGLRISCGDDLGSPALKYLKSLIRQERRTDIEITLDENESR